MSSYSLQVGQGAGDAPQSIVLAPGEDLQPQSVTCRFDGAGASGSFLVCLAIYAQSGELISRTCAPVTNAAGDTGVVTFAPFLGSEPSAAPVSGGILAWILYDNDGATDLSNVMLLDPDLSTNTQLTSNADQEYADQPVLSPDASRVLYIRNEVAMNRNLWVVNVDGSGHASVRAAQTEFPQWATVDTIAFQDSTNRVKRIDADGSGEAFVVNDPGVHGFDCEPNGNRVAYLVLNGAQNDLRIVDLDGTNDTLLLANVGVNASGNSPVWRLDGSRIVFPFGAGIDSILPDGTGQQTELVAYPAGFYYLTGMGSTALFWTDQTVFANWRIAALTFGTGYAALVPALIVVSSIFRGVPMAAGGRVFTVSKNTGPSGEDQLVSVLPDGSDLTVSFTPDESGAPNFQQVFLK